MLEKAYLAGFIAAFLMPSISHAAVFTFDFAPSAGSGQLSFAGERPAGAYQLD